jgi:hypothetical protein
MNTGFLRYLIRVHLWVAVVSVLHPNYNTDILFDLFRRLA